MKTGLVLSTMCFFAAILSSPSALAFPAAPTMLKSAKAEQPAPAPVLKQFTTVTYDATKKHPEFRYKLYVYHVTLVMSHEPLSQERRAALRKAAYGFLADNCEAMCLDLNWYSKVKKERLSGPAAEYLRRLGMDVHVHVIYTADRHDCDQSRYVLEPACAEASGL